jgi:hypothetical protein
MARFDIETFLDQLQTRLKTTLNQKITQINTEKNDQLLPQIPAEAFLFGSLDDQAHNWNDFVFTFVDAIDTKISGPRYSKDYTIEIDLFMYDRQDKNIQKRILRSQEALQMAVMECWEKIGIGLDRVEINSLEAIDVQLPNSSFYHKVVGLKLNFSIFY